MNKIKKAIIPAAGLGTRFLPVTKALPKEMLPIIDTPTLQYIVEEAAASGIEEIGIIVSEAKPSIQNHFSRNYKLEEQLIVAGKISEARLISHIGSLAHIKFILQEEPKGLGHAVLCAREFIGDDDFAVMLGDDLIINPNGTPVLKQLIDEYETHKGTILGVKSVPQDQTSLYGIVKPVKEVGKIFQIDGMVEKPKENAPSTYAALGRYVLSNTIFDKLEKQNAGEGNEIQLTDAIREVMKDEKVYAYEFDGTRYDIGNKFGFIKATIDFALMRPELKDQVKEYIKNIK